MSPGFGPVYTSKIETPEFSSRAAIAVTRLHSLLGPPTLLQTRAIRTAPFLHHPAGGHVVSSPPRGDAVTRCEELVTATPEGDVRLCAHLPVLFPLSLCLSVSLVVGCCDGERECSRITLPLMSNPDDLGASECKRRLGLGEELGGRQEPVQLLLPTIPSHIRSTNENPD